MSGEASVRSGNDGQKICREILNLIGWKSPAENFDFDCALRAKHKKKDAAGNRESHGVDFLYYYESPLIHQRQDVVISSAKHSQKKYPAALKSTLYSYLKDLAQDIECSHRSDDIYERAPTPTGFKNSYKGILFWLGSEEVKDYDIIERLEIDLDLKGINFDEIYIVDNRKATFLVSCINTAKAYRPEQKVKFLYPHTGRNMGLEDLLVTGEILPIQLINSELIPIIKESSEKVTCFFFCANPFSKENLSRLIWLSHKMSGLVNEIRIYFPDYDSTNLHVVNSVKQTFKDENLTSKVSVHRLGISDFVSLKEEQDTNVTDLSMVLPDKREIKKSLLSTIPDDIDKILPYGEMLLPKLRSANLLSEFNLRNFLLLKGIVTNRETKDDLLPIFATLLLSPKELDFLKNIYREKEDKPKAIKRKVKWDNENYSLWEAINEMPDLISLESISLPKNCTIINNPRISRVNSNPNHLEVSYQIEKENTSKDFLTGKTYHPSKIEILMKDAQLEFRMEHTSGDTYKTNVKYFDKFEKQARVKKFISEDFQIIKFKYFTNRGRIQFLLNFFDLRNSQSIKIYDADLEGIKFKPDDNCEDLPEDLESMKGKVSNLNLNGKELNDTVYISQEKYKNAILCEKMKFKLKFDYMNSKGMCFVELSFPNATYSSLYNPELQISITPYSKNNLSVSFNTIKTKIEAEVEKLKDTNYSKFKTLISD
ncbi:hypothetical protein [Rufibacter ruber]|uniref:hypothetical protein n=1 Tax=Rufibacter ruber TaxID=1783499 RepID=UPI000836E58E|nr:hypothetical protein [Rufibacter ruber]